MPRVSCLPGRTRHWHQCTVPKMRQVPPLSVHFRLYRQTACLDDEQGGWLDADAVHAKSGVRSAGLVPSGPVPVGERGSGGAVLGVVKPETTGTGRVLKKLVHPGEPYGVRAFGKVAEPRQPPLRLDKRGCHHSRLFRAEGTALCQPRVEQMRAPRAFAQPWVTSPRKPTAPTGRP